MAEVLAKLSNIHVSPQKARLVADLIRGKQVEAALETLSFNKQKSAGIIKKILNSAIANAEHNEGMDVDDLRVNRIFVDEGRVQKRFRARARGRGNQILKRYSHITVCVSDALNDNSGEM